MKTTIPYRLMPVPTRFFATARPYLLIVGAWLPFFAMWVAFSAGTQPVPSAVTSGVVAFGSACIMSFGVWKFCDRHPWPQRVRVDFYFQHFSAGALFATIWMLCVSGVYAQWHQVSLFDELTTSSYVVWNFLNGFGIYGVIAGVSYSVQTARRLQRETQAAAEARATAMSARLDAIHARLHPHFLFNALHTVSALIRYDPERAEVATQQLGDMLRYALGRDDQGVVPFSDEWAFTRRYLDFQALRFGDRLRLETTIAHASLPVLVPVFCLQTLVENSVHHSVDQNPAGGRVDIATWVEDDTLHLRVRDDGGGAPRAAGSGSGQSIGLRSLRERLETLYRGAASIVVAGSDTAGFDVTVTIPVSHESMPSSNWRAPSDAAAI